MKVISSTDPLFSAACNAVDAMHKFWELKQDLHPAAVQWIETSDGELLLYTRSEYKSAIRKAIKDNLSDGIMFEQIEVQNDTNEL